MKMMKILLLDLSIYTSYSMPHRYLPDKALELFTLFTGYQSSVGYNYKIDRVFSHTST